MAAIEKIEAKPGPLSSKVILERSEYESLATAAKKYTASEKKRCCGTMPADAVLS